MISPFIVWLEFAVALISLITPGDDEAIKVILSGEAWFALVSVKTAHWMHPA